MRIITIQSVEVFRLLKRNEIYLASLSKNSNLPYKLMMEQYHYIHSPIFGCVAGRLSNFGGANIKNSVILELEVPDEYVNLQSYVEWNNLIKYMEDLNTWTENYSIFDFATMVLSGIDTIYDNTVIQATIPRIEPKWLVNKHTITKKFLNLHYEVSNRLIKENYT